jgi:hypothetical protein
MNMMSLITDIGLEFFSLIDKNQIENVQKGKRTLVQTIDGKEHLGVYISFDNREQCLKLQAIDNSIIIQVSLDKIENLYQTL